MYSKSITLLQISFWSLLPTAIVGGCAREQFQTIELSGILQFSSCSGDHYVILRCEFDVSHRGTTVHQFRSCLPQWAPPKWPRFDRTNRSAVLCRTPDALSRLSRPKIVSWVLVCLIVKWSELISIWLQIRFNLGSMNLVRHEYKANINWIIFSEYRR